MMKTTLAVAAVIATATVANADLYLSATDAAAVGALAECPEAKVTVTGRVGPTAYGKFIIDIEATEDGVPADVTACAAKAAATTDALLADCFTTPVAGTYVAKDGANAFCPKKAGFPCTLKDDAAEPPTILESCATVDEKSTVCTDAKVCLYPVPTQSLVSVSKFKLFYKEAAKKTTPEPIAKASLEAATACGLTAPAYAAPADKKGLSVRSTQALNKETCDIAAYKKTIQDAVDAYNKDAKAEDKYDTTFGDIKQVAVKKECFDATKNTFFCATTTGCDILCADEIVCTDEKVCGSGVCKDTTTPAKFMAQADPVVEKKCFSNAVASIVAPVLAAALAVAFF